MAALLDTETSVPGVTSAPYRAELKPIGPIIRKDGKDLNIEEGDLAVTANWGYLNKAGVIMPGQGLIECRAYTPDELSALEQGASLLGLDRDQVIQLLGETTCDIYLNGNVFWKNVPNNVWEYVIGGFQVIKKWLSYRENKLLGRSLNTNEAREVTGIARRIAAIVLMGPMLDANYENSTLSHYHWSK